MLATARETSQLKLGSINIQYKPQGKQGKSTLGWAWARLHHQPGPSRLSFTTPYSISIELSYN